jgi:hypothetical protein
MLAEPPFLIIKAGAYICLLQKFWCLKQSSYGNYEVMPY